MFILAAAVRGSFLSFWNTAKVRDIYHPLLTWHWFKVLEYRFFGVVFLPFAFGFASIALDGLRYKVARKPLSRTLRTLRMVGQSLMCAQMDSKRIFSHDHKTDRVLASILEFSLLAYAHQRLISQSPFQMSEQDVIVASSSNNKYMVPWLCSCHCGFYLVLYYIRS